MTACWAPSFGHSVSTIQSGRSDEVGDCRESRAFGAAFLLLVLALGGLYGPMSHILVFCLWAEDFRSWRPLVLGRTRTGTRSSSGMCRLRLSAQLRKPCLGLTGAAAHPHILNALWLEKRL
jgi:hypothetical protein